MPRHPPHPDQLLLVDPDYVEAPRFGNSLRRVVEEGRVPAYEGGAIPRQVAQMLRLTQQRALALKEAALEKLRAIVPNSER